MDIYRILHETLNNTHPSQKPMGLSIKTDHVLGHQARKIDNIICILSDHNGVQLGINSNRCYRIYTSSWELNSRMVNDN